MYVSMYLYNNIGNNIIIILSTLVVVSKIPPRPSPHVTILDNAYIIMCNAIIRAKEIGTLYIPIHRIGVTV